MDAVDPKLLRTMDQALAAAFKARLQSKSGKRKKLGKTLQSFCQFCWSGLVGPLNFSFMPHIENNAGRIFSIKTLSFVLSKTQMSAKLSLVYHQTSSCCISIIYSIIYPFDLCCFKPHAGSRVHKWILCEVIVVLLIAEASS